MVSHLETILELCWAASGSLAALLGLSWNSLGVSWRLLKAMVGHLEAILGLCCAAWDSLGALLAASEGYGGPFGDCIGAMLGSLGLSWGSLGGF